MRSELLIIEKIEKYIEGSLSDTELAAFEKQMAVDPDLQNKVAFQKNFIQGIARADMKIDITQAAVKYKKLAFLSKLAYIGASAITGSVVTLAVVHYVGNSSNQQNIPNNQLSEHVIAIDSVEKINTKDTLNLEQALKDSLKISVAEVPNKNTASTNNFVKEKENAIPSKKENEIKLASLFWNNNTSLTWLGMDFTACKFYGNFSENTDDILFNESKIANKSFTNWNDLYLSEKKKYDFKNAFNTDQIQYAMDLVNKRNDTINNQRLQVFNETDLNHLNQNKIETIIQSYNLNEKEGLGLVFMVESLDKTKQKSSVWVTIIDIKTKEILLTEKMLASPSGIGTKNYWSHSFYTIIKTIESKRYNEWKKLYKL